MRILSTIAVDYGVFLGQFEKGIQLGNETLRINPHSKGGYVAVAGGYLGLNRPDDTKAFLESALTKDPDHPTIHYNLYPTYAALGDESGAERELQRASGKLEMARLLGDGASGRAAHLGKIQKAREYSTQALQTFESNQFKESAAGVMAFMALIEAEVGNTAAARQRTAAAMALSRTRTNLPAIAVALALAGDSSGARSIIDDLKRRYPSDLRGEQRFCSISGGALAIQPREYLGCHPGFATS
jgi:tetratricopeptide (TPR) repeat protein